MYIFINLSLFYDHVSIFIFFFMIFPLNIDILSPFAVTRGDARGHYEIPYKLHFKVFLYITFKLFEPQKSICTQNKGTLNSISMVLLKMLFR